MSAILLVYLIVVPLGEIVTTTLKWQPKDIRISPNARTRTVHALSLDRDVHGQDGLLPALGAPRQLPCRSVVRLHLLSPRRGGMMAWVVTRTDIPARKFLSFSILVPYMLPSLVQGPRVDNGLQERPYRRLSGISPGDFRDQPARLAFLRLRAHRPHPLDSLLRLRLSPHIVGLIVHRRRPRGNGGRSLGANRFQILKRITFPLVLPAILSSFILTFSRAIGTFGVPAFLGLKTNYYTISTMLYSSVRSRRTVQAYILSVVLIAIAVFTVWLNQRMIGKRKSYATIGGKGTRRNLISLGKWRTPIFVVILVFIGIAVLFPVGILLFQTFMLKDGVYSFREPHSPLLDRRVQPENLRGRSGHIPESRDLGPPFSAR